MWLYGDLQAAISASLSEIFICSTRTSPSSSCQQPSWASVTGCCGSSSLHSLIIGLQAFLLVIILVHADPTGLPLRGPSDVDRVMGPLATSDDTRVLLWHELFCLPAWSCVRPRKHSSRLRLASLSCITTGTVCVPFSQSSSRLHSRVWVGRGSFLSPSLHSRARHWRRNSAGTTYVV